MGMNEAKAVNEAKALNEQTKRRIADFTQEQAARYLEDAQDDMAVYMHDFIADLMEKGMSEDDAFEKACEAMRAESGTPQAATMQEKMQDKMKQYYADRSSATEEVIGLLYGGTMILSLVVGGLIGFVLGGGMLGFANGGWISMLVGLGVGAVTGAGLGLVAHAAAVARARR